MDRHQHNQMHTKHNLLIPIYSLKNAWTSEVAQQVKMLSDFSHWDSIGGWELVLCPPCAGCVCMNAGVQVSALPGRSRLETIKSENKILIYDQAWFHTPLLSTGRQRQVGLRGLRALLEVTAQLPGDSSVVKCLMDLGGTVSSRFSGLCPRKWGTCGLEMWVRG